MKREMDSMIGVNATVVYFEYLSLKEQFKAAYCSDIIAGVSGAGLAWTLLQQDGRAFVEIFWEGWPVYYDKVPKKHRPDIHHYTLQAKEVVYNEAALQEMFKYNTPIDNELFRARTVRLDTGEFCHIIKLIKGNRSQ